MMRPIPASPTASRTRGFTIIEMMVVLGLIALMLTASVAAVDQFMKDTGAESALRIVRGALFAAKMKAIRERKTIEFDAHSMGALVTFEPKGSGTGSVIDCKGVDPRWRTNAFQGLYAQARPSVSGSYAEAGGWAPIDHNDSNTIFLKSGSSLGSLGLPPVLDIVQEAGSTQMCVTADRNSEQWKLLPRFMYVYAHEKSSTDSQLPIGFRPDGSLDISKYMIVLDIMDTRGEIGDKTRTLHLYRNTGAIREYVK